MAKILKPGTDNQVPKSFIGKCRKYGKRGCGCEMEVFPEDCFITPGAEQDRLSFFCEQCGLALTPDEEGILRKDWERNWSDLPPDNFYIMEENNRPPWWPGQGFMKRAEYCEKNNIEWGFRPA